MSNLQYIILCTCSSGMDMVCSKDNAFLYKLPRGFNIAADDEPPESLALLRIPLPDPFELGIEGPGVRAREGRVSVEEELEPTYCL